MRGVNPCPANEKEEFTMPWNFNILELKLTYGMFI